MSGSVAEAPKALTASAEQTTSRPKNRKLDQWIAFWTVPFFFNGFGLVFVLAAAGREAMRVKSARLEARQVG